MRWIAGWIASMALGLAGAADAAATFSASQTVDSSGFTPGYVDFPQALPIFTLDPGQSVVDTITFTDPVSDGREGCGLHGCGRGWRIPGGFNVGESGAIAAPGSTGTDLITFSTDAVQQGADLFGLIFTVTNAGDVLKLPFYQGVGYQTPSLIQFSVLAIPEPASWSMMLAGFGMVGATLRRRTRRTGFAST